MNRLPSSQAKTSQDTVLDLEERNWLPRYCRGDKQAFDELLLAYRNLVSTILFRYGIEGRHRDDLFQDIFFKILQSAPRYRPTKPLRPWVVSIVLNSARNFRRDRGRRKHAMTRLKSVTGSHHPETPLPQRHDPGPDEQLEHQSTVVWLEQRITTLPEQQREVLVLSTIKGLRMKDIATVMALPENTVKTHLRRARLALAESLVRQQDDALDAHLQACGECRKLLQAWEQIPDLLDNLPDHEPDEVVVQKVREMAYAGRRDTTTRRLGFLAPSLASAAVLLAAIGLSRELLMHESPTYLAAPAKRQLTGELVKNPASAPAPVSMEGLDESSAYRSDDAPLVVKQKVAEETDRLERRGERRRDAASMTAFESTRSPVDPTEEKRFNQARQKVDLKDLDAEFNFALNLPAIRESEEQSLGRKSKNHKKESPDTEGPEASVSEAIALGGTFAGDDFDFLGHYQQTENLQFQSATGYWANQYIPGDPEIRLLSARLAQWDRTWLDNNAALEKAVAPVQQPFDAPANNALALSLMADISAVSGLDGGPTRMRLQVGIQGIEHRRGQRPAMNVGVVVDLPADAPDEVRIAARALLDALRESEQAGDHFSVVNTGSGLDLYSALLKASNVVQQTDDPGRPLGSSSLLLISAGSLANVEHLTALAHEKATEGVTMSVIPLGSRPLNESVEKLVLAGLGNRRFLEAPGQARRLIEEELHASSRAVARAARLSIRLAPGVRLINVVGSERLDTQRSQRVREIENSMDRRLSANLGIQADRGEDEDGIQIVIPSIFSGDSVTVLLDVVTNRPGAIADVSLRYKDLVFLGNNNLQSHLELGRGENKRGPAELAVLKNLLSYHFVEAVEKAADALGRQQPAQAIDVLRSMRNMIEKTRQDIPAWTGDPDLVRDSRVLDRYIAALTSPGAGAHHLFLTDSLRYAAWAKTHRLLPEYATRSELNEHPQ